jgi:hypothetical protein
MRKLKVWVGGYPAVKSRGKIYTNVLCAVAAPSRTKASAITGVPVKELLMLFQETTDPVILATANKQGAWLFNNEDGKLLRKVTKEDVANYGRNPQ